MASQTFLVMSDSHGDRAIVEKLKTKYQGQVTAMFHNGDSELPASDPIWSGIHVVEGNCDWEGPYPPTNVVTYGDITIAQTHGHLFGINFGWERLDLFAQEADANLCLYGHLHVPAAWPNGKTIFINPGSISQPRGEITEKLYALVTVTESTITVRYYNRDHQEHQALTKEFAR